MKLIFNHQNYIKNINRSIKKNQNYNKHMKTLLFNTNN
jgi:hypothetical protein